MADPSEVAVYVEVAPVDVPARAARRPRRPLAGPDGVLWQPCGDDGVLLPRRTLYLQAVLLVAVGVVGLAAGYFMGRQDTSVDRLLAEEEASGERVLIEGRLVYRDRDGEAMGDAGAVVVFLPQKRRAASEIPASGIRPEDPPPPMDGQGLRRIGELGGAYARADRQGNFSAVLPDRGRYHVLVVSAKTWRPENAMIEPADLDELRRYFDRPEDLIGRHKYRLLVQQFEARARVEHDFGRSG